MRYAPSIPVVAAIVTAVAIACGLLLAPFVGYRQARSGLLSADGADLAAPLSAASNPSKSIGVPITYPPKIDLDGQTVADANDAELADRVNQIWEANAQQPVTLRPQPLTEPNWTISGVVQNGANTSVMVQFQGESQVRFYKVGDVLPGGGKLAWVKPGAIGVVTAKRQKIEVPILDGSNAR